MARGPGVAHVCLAMLLLAGPWITSAMRIPLRKVEGAGRMARSEVPQPLSQNTQGFVMDILLGSPQQTLSVEVDTGSYDLLVFGPGCQRSVCPGPKYSPTDSRTFTPAVCPDDTKTYLCAFCTPDLVCAINATDASGALITGTVDIDLATVYGLKPAYVYYGQLTSFADGAGNPVITGTRVSGRLGLGYGKDGIFGLQSPLYIIQWVNQLPLGFSLCMNADGAFIDMGELLATSSIYQWAAGRSPDYYAILLSDIGITRNPPNGGRFNIVPTNAKIDSLLNGFIFPAYLRANTKAAFAGLCPGIPGICGAPFIWNGPVSLSSSDVNSYPSLVLVNDEISDPIVIDPASYLINNNDGTYSMGIAFSGDIFVLGLPFIAMYRIGIDLLFPGGYGRIGLAPTASCGTNQRLTTSDAATSTASTAAVAASTAATVASTTNSAATSSIRAESSAEVSSTASLRASTTQSVIMSTLSLSASGNGPAQASTTATASTTTTAYVAASTLATSTSRATASASATATSTAAATTTGYAASLTSSLSALSASITGSTTAAVDSSTNAVTATNVLSLSAASSSVAATTAIESTSLASTLTADVTSSTAASSTAATRSSITSTSVVVSTRTSSTVSAATSLTAVSATATVISSTQAEASASSTASAAVTATTATSSTNGPSSTTSTVTTNTINHKHQPAISTGEVVAIVVLGTICVLAILALIAVCYHRNKSDGYMPLNPAGVGPKGYVGMD